MALFCIGKVAEECRGGCNRHNRVQTSLVGRQRRAAMRPREPRATVGLGVSPSPSQVALGPERERPTRSCVLRARRPVDRGERAAAAVNKMKKMRQCPTYWLWLEGSARGPRGKDRVACSQPSHPRLPMLACKRRRKKSRRWMNKVE